MTPLKDRIVAILKTILADSAIPKQYHPIILNFVIPKLKQTDDKEIEKGIYYLRDTMLPFLLGGENGKADNQNPSG